MVLKGISAIFLLCLFTLGQSQRFKGEKEKEVVHPQYPEIHQCPEDYGLQLYPHPARCDTFYSCKNGTLAMEVCENGLLFDGRGNIHNYCNYHWAVNCEGREFELNPNGRGTCSYDFGLFEAGPCEGYFEQCEYGQPTAKPCEYGLAFDGSIHDCNWPDLIKTCDAEKFIGFTCPPFHELSRQAQRFVPFPRFSFPQDKTGSSFLVCVNELPRLHRCGDYSVFNKEILACDDPENVLRSAGRFK